MDPRHLPSTKAYLRLKDQVQVVFDFSVVVSFAVPALKRQISLLDKGVISSLPRPDYYTQSTNPPAQLQAQAVSYKKQLAAYTLISVFSFFEAFVIDAINEMIDYHGGQDEFIRRAEEHDKKALSIAIPDQERAKQRLRGTKEKNKTQRYEKYSKQLVESGYRFPSERLSGYGARMLIQKVGSLKAKEIPDLLIHGLHMTIDAKTIEEFHRIRDIRNSIAHGSGTFLSLREVADMNETLRKLAHSFDKHLNEHFLISEDYI